jgi:CRP-like cAMP-binding protein
VYTATAIASVPCELLVVRGADLRNLVKQHPEAGRRLLQRLAMAVSPRWEGAYSSVIDLISRTLEEQTD